MVTDDDLCLPFFCDDFTKFFTFLLYFEFLEQSTGIWRDRMPMMVSSDSMLGIIINLDI